MKQKNNDKWKKYRYAMYSGIALFVAAFMGVLEGTSSIVFTVLFLSYVIEYHYLNAVNRE